MYVYVSIYVYTYVIYIACYMYVIIFSLKFCLETQSISLEQLYLCHKNCQLKYL